MGTACDSDDLAAAVAGLSLGDGASSESRGDGDAPSSPALRTLARWIDAECEEIVVLSGAGVSVAAGIPDFRTPGTGLYDNLQQYDLSQPEDIFDVDFYRRNPRPFVSLAKEIWPGRVHSPTLTHSFLSLLASKGKLRRAYTQNIDGLEVLAGLPPEKVVECHGHFRTASCVDCGKGADIDRVVDVITRRGEAPACDGCGGYVKPDVVFFGEDLPGRFHRLLRPDLQAADLLIILGTSLQVAPVSRIPDMVPRACRRALLNRELVGNLDVAGGGGGGRKARRNKKRRQDVYHEGDCDDSIVTLARLLGWHDELLELNARTKVGPQSDKRKGRKING